MSGMSTTSSGSVSTVSSVVVVVASVVSGVFGRPDCPAEGSASLPPPHATAPTARAASRRATGDLRMVLLEDPGCRSDDDVDEVGGAHDDLAGFAAVEVGAHLVGRERGALGFVVADVGGHVDTVA